MPKFAACARVELVNQHGKTLCHVDPRDCGILGKLLCAEAALAAGIEVVKYRRHRPPPPDTPEGDFLQTVVVIFFGCSEMEALSIIGLEASEHSAILKAPLGQGGVMMAIYLLDFSKRYHGNPRSSAGLPPGAWAFRATPYATVHGATWAQRIELMPPPQAEQLLRSLARLPGGATLGARKKRSMTTPLAQAASSAEVEEAEEAARVQEEAALALGGALGSADGGRVHDGALAQAAAVDDEHGDYLVVNIEKHTTQDTILPIGTEVEVFFNTDKWERAQVTGHIPEVCARDAVYYHHVFLYESDQTVLSHHRGTIMLRMRRSVHADLQRTKTTTSTGCLPRTRSGTF